MMRAWMGWAVLGSLAMAPAVRAQSPTQRSGVIVGVGMGVGTFRAECDACGGASASGFDREVTVAVALGPRLQVGLAVAGWVGTYQGYSEKEAAILAAVRAYPHPRLPLHLAAGVGQGRYRVGYEAPGSPKQRIRADGSTVALTIGYDLRLDDRVVVVPQVSYRQMARSPLEFDGSDLVESGFRTIAIGAAIRWRAVPFGVEPEPR